MHLIKNELPPGKLIVQCARHLTSVIDGIINDTWDCPDKCVYGYYSFSSPTKKFAIGEEVIYQGKKTEVISFIPNIFFAYSKLQKRSWVKLLLRRHSFYLSILNLLSASVS